MNIKKFLLGCIVLSAALFINACSDVRLNLLDEQEKTLSDFHGQWLFINYWAEWCKPCLQEIPELNKFNLEKNVTVLGLNYDDLEEDVLREQVKAFGIHYSSLLEDPSVELKQKTPAGLPATMVISPKGEVLKWLYGAQTQDSLEVIIK